MRRLVLFFLVIGISVVCMAESPNLACQKIFERKDLYSKGYDIVKINQPYNYFRCIKARKDKKLMREVQKAFEKDSRRACNMVENRSSSGKISSVINIEHKGYMINIGLVCDSEGNLKLFMQSEPEAFE